MAPPSARRVGFIGLGDIGLPMAMRLHEQGHDLTVWARRPEVARPFAEAGVEVAGSAADLAGRCDIVCLCLTPTSSVEEVVFGPAGVAAAASAPRLVVDHSTISPETTCDFADRLRVLTGTSWLDALISGGPSGARAGTLAVMAGGSESDFALALPVLQSLGRTVTRVGELGRGQVAKACNQVVGFIIHAAIAEGLGCAAGAGVPPAVMAGIMTGGLADSAALAEYRRATAAGEPGGITGVIGAYMDLARDHVRPEYAGKLDVFFKDAAIAKQIASSSGLELPLFEQVEAMARRLNYQ